MVLTRTWGVFLALFASLCLGGMFLLSRGTSGEFSESDRAALRAVTEAGIASLSAQIDASPVRQVAHVLLRDDLREALARTPDEEAKLASDQLSLAQIFTEAAEEFRVSNKSDMTVALIEESGSIAAVSGIGEPLLAELIGSTPYQELPATDDRLFSLTLGSQINVVRVEHADARKRRLVAFEPLQVGAGSLLRRVLGTDNPAGLVRNGKLHGEIIGDQPVTQEIERLANDHRDDTPDDGASKVFTVGEGLAARIGAIGRVPGPAGKGKAGSLLVVLSQRTAAAGGRDLTDAIADARRKGLTSQVNWVLLLFLAAVCSALALFLPSLEALGPMRRLTDEFQAIARGAQHQIFHDRYGGAAGEVARAANAAHEALRAAYVAALEVDEEVADEDSARVRPKTVRGRKLTRGGRRVDDGTEAPANTTVPTPAAEPVPVNSGQRSAAAPFPVEVRAPDPPPPFEPPPPLDRTEPAIVQPRDPPRRSEPARGGTDPARAPAVAPRRATDPATAAATPPVPPPRPPLARPLTPAVVTAPNPPPNPTPSVPHPAPAPVGEAADTARAARYRETYDEFLQVKIACGENTEGFTFDKFAKKLEKNTQDILDKHADVRDVQFTVYVKDGKAALKARVIRGTGS